MVNFKSSSILKGALVLPMISALILSGCGTKANTAESSPEAAQAEATQQDASGSEDVLPFKGFVAPNFSLEDLSGNQIRLWDLSGKTVVVNFWSLDCPDCLNEMPEFDDFNKSKSSDVELLMVNIDTYESKVKEYIQREGYAFRVLMDKKGEAAKAYLIRSTPTTLVIGKDGIVTARFEGALNGEILESLVGLDDSCPVPS